MHEVRRRLAALALAVVMLQIAGVAATSIALSRAGNATPADDMMATCNHGPGVMCPMHAHHQPPASSHETRFCRGCDNATDLVLTTLVAFAAPIAERYQPHAPDAVSPAFALETSRILDLARLPIAPPPRG